MVQEEATPSDALGWVSIGKCKEAKDSKIWKSSWGECNGSALPHFVKEWK